MQVFIQQFHYQNRFYDFFNLTTFDNIIFSGTYYAAVMENHVDFHGRVVVDVGAGSGILSLFAAQVNFIVQHLNFFIGLFNTLNNEYTICIFWVPFCIINDTIWPLAFFFG